MKYTIFFCCFLILHHVQSVDTQFDSSCLPTFSAVNVIDPQTIQGVWKGSCPLSSIDLLANQSLVTITLGVSGRKGNGVTTSQYNGTVLNSTGAITLSQLSADSIYIAWMTCEYLRMSNITPAYYTVGTKTSGYQLFRTKASK